MRPGDIGNTFIHLTNVAIQKHAPSFDRWCSLCVPVGAGEAACVHCTPLVCCPPAMGTRGHAFGGLTHTHTGPRPLLPPPYRDRGMKWPLRSLRLFLTTRHGAFAQKRLLSLRQHQPGAALALNTSAIAG